MNLQEAQKAVYKNKINKAFNVTDINKDLLGLSEILGIDLASEIEKKIEINYEREYEIVNGV